MDNADIAKTYESSNKKINTRLALLEQSQKYMQDTIDKSQNYINQCLSRIERKMEVIDNKMEKIESKVYANLKWIIGISIPIFFSVSSFIFELYKYVKVM